MAETPLFITQTPRAQTLTCDADVGFPALGGARRAPGNALAPVIFGPEELLDLLPRNFDAHLSDNQTCEGTRNAGQCRADRQKEGNIGTEVSLQSHETSQLSTSIYLATQTVVRMRWKKKQHFISLII